MTKKILISIDWFEPAYKAGGPIRSIKNLVELLKGDFDFYILTSDRDLGDEKPFEEVSFNTWLHMDGIWIHYLSKEKQNFANFKRILGEREYDKYYFNSLFSVRFTLLPLLILKLGGKGSRAILAPRGMLGTGALEIRPLKKKIFLKLSRTLGLFEHIGWHASTELEKQEIINAFGPGAKVEVAQNISEQPPELVPLIKKDATRFIFLSRISSKKNLLAALSFFENLDFKEEKVQFHIYGPIEDQKYWRQCEGAIRKISPQIEVAYKGNLRRKEVYPTVSQYHFMLFPTKNENFGHNIAEALMCGLPVIISDQTPWKNLGDHKAGWDIPLQKTVQFEKAIEQAVKMENREYQEWRKATRKFAEERLFSLDLFERNQNLFL